MVSYEYFKVRAFKVVIMSIIIAENLSKSYPVAVKEPGFWGTINHFFRRTYREIAAVQDVSFEINPGEVVGFLGLMVLVKLLL